MTEKEGPVTEQPTDDDDEDRETGDAPPPDGKRWPPSLDHK